MKTNPTQIGIILISILVSIISYNYLPDTIASHWNLQGIADGYSSKLASMIALPSLLILLYLFLLFVPKLDPLKKNIKIFQEEFSKFITLLLGFLLLLQLQIILWNMGYQIPFNILMPILLGVLIYEIGNLLGKSKRNWSIGIRTPWTISNEKVWNSTHKLGAQLFKLTLPISIISVFFPPFTFFIIVGYILGITLFLCYFSYKKYSKN